jgi:uncharacterized protein (TIGR03790 family)
VKLWLTFFCTLLTVGAFAANDGSDVVVVYNSTMPESKDVAEHYASMRSVPAAHVIGFHLPKTEVMSRAQYREQLQDPLLQSLEKQNLFTFKRTKLVDAQIRYIVLCYGVPLRIERDSTLKEKIDPQLREDLRNNGAAVDSELAALPRIRENLALAGPLPNPLFHITNSAPISPTNGLIIVARLDGPTAEIARSLVDKAIQAERDGLWGRTYIDARSITNAGYAEADTNFLVAAEAAQRSGFDTVIDKNPQTFSAAFPMSQIALYAGWYDEHVSGPFTRAKVEFMPGAFAYHQHSFSAQTLRSTNSHWAGPLLAKGATATIGTVDEPYIGGFPDMSIFFTRWLMLGLTYGEAAYSSLPVISWQATVVGDPLYQPFRKDPQQLHRELADRGSKLVEWSHLRVVNLNAAMRTPLPELIQYLKDEPTTKTSPVLTEKLGDLYSFQGKQDSSIEAYRDALKLNPTPQQEVRLRLIIMNKLGAVGKVQDIRAELDEFKKHCPDYPELNILDQQVRRATSAPAPK